MRLCSVFLRWVDVLGGGGCIQSPSYKKIIIVNLYNKPFNKSFQI